MCALKLYNDLPLDIGHSVCAPKLYNDLPLDVGHSVCAPKLFNDLPLDVGHSVWPRFINPRFSRRSIDSHKDGSRAFSHAAPTIWNNLPHDVRETTSINSFRTRINTFYFKSAY